MEIYCLQEFKSKFEKLKKKNSYLSIEREIIDNFFGKKPLDFFKQGSRITGTAEIPFIKKRISGSGGWRIYYLLLIKDGKLYLMYIHPKTGSMALENIGENFEKTLYDEILSCIKSNDIFRLTVENYKLIFTHNLIKNEDIIKMNELIDPIQTKQVENLEEISSKSDDQIN